MSVPVFPSTGRLRATAPLLFILILALFLEGCREDSGETAAEIPLETARLVSETTAGMIGVRDAVTVRFTTPVIAAGLVGSTVTKTVFFFEPEIPGTVRWRDRQTIELVPDNPLAMRQTYRGTLDLRALLPAYGDAETLQPLPIAFETAGREIAGLDSDFELVDPDDPRRLRVVGEVRFTEPIDRGAVGDALGLVEKGRGLTLSIEGEPNGTRFTFRSDPIERTDRDRNLILRLQEAPLRISRTVERALTLPAYARLSLTEAAAEGETGDAVIRLTFSDALDPRREVSGLIRVEPSLAVTARVLGREVVLSGPFKSGERYTVVVEGGLRSRWGTTLSGPVRREIAFAQLKPRLRFVHDGAILPSANQREVRFATLNVARVQLEIKRVFENNLVQFLQTERLGGERTRNEQFTDGFVRRVGVVVHSDTLELSGERNAWQTHALDLRTLIGARDRGLYLIKLAFRQEDMLYESPDDDTRSYYWGEEYYSNPRSPGYVWRHGQVYKPILVSDIGLTYKAAANRNLVYATHIGEARALGGVKVTLKSYQNQILASGESNDRGQVSLPAVDEEVFVVEGEWSGQRSVIQTGRMGWNLSGFDTDGAEAADEGLRAFLYTERGVYRPGDPVNLSMIIRNDDETFPEDHPVAVTVYDPRNRKRLERTLREGRDGFYHLPFETAPEDPTGGWRIEVLAGSKRFYHDLAIETVVPFRLKVELTSPERRLGSDAERLSLDLSSQYLFGTPAAGLDAEVSLVLDKAPLTVERWPGFAFDNPVREYDALRRSLFSGALDSDGAAAVTYTLPELSESPSALEARLEARVYEPGGRPNTARLTLPVDPYPRYVGIRLPETEYGVARVGAEQQLAMVVVSPDGKTVPGRPLRYRIYQGSRYWWYDYEGDYRDYRLRFKSHSTTRAIREGELTSGAEPVVLGFVPEDDGTYYIEVQDGDDGHLAGAFLQASGWAGGAGREAAMLALRTDRDSYRVGETARVRFPVPDEGQVLFSLERGREILESEWRRPTRDEKGQMAIDIPITAAMVPTTYATVSIIQPHAQTANDRPIRLYGVVPLQIVNPDTRHDLRLEVPGELRANEEFDVVVQTGDRRPAQVTVAVVDEGLLALTDFRTPDPWDHFYRKLRLGVNTFDLFDEVIGANTGDVLSVFSIGGGMAEAYRRDQQGAEGRRRFPPVSLFEGPVNTDDNGRAVARFTMPDYVGAVRVMAVSATGARYGRADRTVPVRTELMVVSSMPRALGPGDRFEVTASVFAMTEDVRTAEVRISADGPLSVVGESRRQVAFAEPGEQEVAFTLEAAEAIGEATVTVSAAKDGHEAASTTEIVIRTAAPRIGDREERPVTPGETVTLAIPDRGIPGSNRATIALRTRPDLNMGERLGWLMRYPYGCVEQTVSAVFPQLYLTTFLAAEGGGGGDSARVDANINAGIDRLRRFQLGDGGFAYWPGSRDVSVWGSLYAGHFLLEARERGYHVPADLLNAWLAYERGMALVTRDPLMARVYRVFLLSLAGEPPTAAMNLLRENNLKDMRVTEKWMLGAAYRLAGVERQADEITRGLDTREEPYSRTDMTYGSRLRDEAIILQTLLQFDRMEAARPLAERIARSLSANDWYSTQSTAFMLMALGRYIHAVEGADGGSPRLAAEVRLPNGQTVTVDHRGFAWQMPVTDGFGDSLSVTLLEGSSVARAYAALEWSGVPLRDTRGAVSRELALKVSWLDEDGMPISVESLRQGTRFWARFTATNPNPEAPLAEVALVQVLPAGWEIENTRLSGESRPEWMNGWNLGREEYQDIRDDRVMWFFDFPRNGRSFDFAIKLNAVSEGRFTLPPALLEAMYDNRFEARVPGGTVRVVPRE